MDQILKGDGKDGEPMQVDALLPQELLSKDLKMGRHRQIGDARRRSRGLPRILHGLEPTDEPSTPTREKAVQGVTCHGMPEVAVLVFRQRGKHRR